QGSAPPPPPPTGPVLSITDALTVAETGDTGTTDLDFGLSLSDASFTGTLQVTYNAGSATNQTQAVNFTGGTGTLTVQVANDDLANGPETVPVTLTGATGTATPVTLGTATASGTVTEDDVAAPPPDGSVLPIDFNANPLLSYSGQDKTPQGFQIDQDGAGITLSGNTWKKTLLPGGTFTVDADTVLRFDVTMQNSTAEFVSIGLENDDNYKTTDDLLFQVFGSINIARFDQSVRNDYTTVGQTVSYEIPLAAHAGRTFDYLALINDDDAAQSSIVRFSNVQLVQGSAPPPPPPTGPVLSITDALTVAETGDTGTTDLDFGLSLSDTGFIGTLQVTYNAGSATNQTQAVSFAGGTGTLTVQVANDDLANGPETVPVTLTGATGTATPVTLGTASASGTVTEDDVAAPPASVVLSITDALTVTEAGDTGTTDLVFDLSLNDTGFTGSLQVAYDAGTATSQSVSFVNGIGSLAVSVANDDVDNGTETVTVTLTGASGAGPTVTLGTATASGMVIEDDVTGGGGTVSTVVTPIGASSDDWEQFGGGGSGDLEFGLNGSRAQAVGMRFEGIDIPQTATITDAYLQFTSLETSSGAANFTIGIQGSETAATFSSGAPPQSRVTADEFAWSNVEQWTAGGTYRTPDISGLIETVIGADGATNAALAFIVAGSGSRVASSFDSGAAPELVLVLDDGSALTL
ncbi:MAG: hypothetical protein ACU0E9_02670, partial [Limimaricola soesokkakensis]|uniref:hypothetical protein n=1 Tax=Limimaricola soesokkakensis TaxID=1343159 RepID=UPI00405859B1